MLIPVQPNPSWQLSLAQLSPSLYRHLSQIFIWTIPHYIRQILRENHWIPDKKWYVQPCLLRSKPSASLQELPRLVLYNNFGHISKSMVCVFIKYKTSYPTIHQLVGLCQIVEVFVTLKPFLSTLYSLIFKLWDLQCKDDCATNSTCA